jgi:hypothetical protein
MIKSYVSYDGKDYEVKEPTISTWSKVQALKDFTDMTEWSIEVISMSTGLSVEEIKEGRWEDVMLVATNITNYFLSQGNKFHKEFEFKDVKYGFIDLNNLSFGEFIDLDTYLSKSPIERQKELHIQMALLYREVGEDGKLIKYDGSLVQARAEIFKDLPIIYVQGALSFFFHLERVLHRNIRSYLWNLLKVKMKKMTKTIVNIFSSFGGGILRLWSWLKKTLQKLRGFLLYP